MLSIPELVTLPCRRHSRLSFRLMGVWSRCGVEGAFGRDRRPHPDHRR